MDPKLFRDPLYDYIQIDQKQPWLLDLINTPEVQRLRYINQLGLSYFTYPGSSHSRFSHSLGVLHLMQQCISYLKQEFQTYFRRLDEEALLASALLHDIGHTPLSHATEEIFGSHEKKTVNIILDPNTEVNQFLRRRAPSFPEKVAALIKKKSDAQF